MGFLKSLGKLAGKAITLPVAVTADIVTLGGVLNDKDKPYTVKNVEGAIEDLEDIADAASEGDLL